MSTTEWSPENGSFQDGSETSGTLNGLESPTDLQSSTGLGSGIDASSDGADAALTVVPVPENADQMDIGDPNLLLHGDYGRDGNDLLITGNGAEGTYGVLIPDWFAQDEPPALVVSGGDGGSGMQLDSSIVERLAGPLAPGQVAQAGANSSAADAIGTMDKVTGTVLVTRADGTQIEAQVGDTVFQGDVVVTEDASAVGIKFIDDSAFSLGSDGRMVIDEFVFDPGTAEGSANASLVTGVFSFVSGQIAKSGPDAMTVTTPVATIGIRGTSGVIKVTVPEGFNPATLEEARSRLSEFNLELEVVLLPETDGTVGEIVFQSFDNQITVVNVPFQGVRATLSRVADSLESNVDSISVDETYVEETGIDKSIQHLPTPTLPTEGEGDGQDQGPVDGETPVEGEGENQDGTQDDSSMQLLDETQEAANVFGDLLDDQGPIDGGEGEVGLDGSEGEEDVLELVVTSSRILYEDISSALFNQQDTGPELVLEDGAGDEFDQGLPELGAGIAVSRDSAGRIVLVMNNGASFNLANTTENIRVQGGGGDEGITTGSGSDEVRAGAGDDAIYTGDGDDAVFGEEGDDEITGGTGQGNDLYDGGDGVDRVTYRSADLGVIVDLAAGFATDATSVSFIDTDTLISIENILGSPGDDTIRGDAVANQLLGTEGNDIIEGRGGNDILDGGTGTDTLNHDSDTFGVNANLTNALAFGTGIGVDAIAGFENISGGAGGDTLTGDAGANIILGNDGNDIIEGLAGDDNLIGGAGNDTLSFASDGSGVAVNLSAGTASGSATGNDAVSGFENVTGGAGGDDITGDAGANVILGEAGNDTIEGLDGNDTLDGGAGNDTLSFATDTSGVTASLINGGATGAAIGTDSVVNFENIVGGSGNDSLTGDAGANVLNGGTGNDTIEGLAGNDTLIGGVGTDTVTYASDAIGVTISLIAGSATGTGVGSDSLSGFENAIGGSGNDTITGDTGANILQGGAGNDIIEGLAGNDSLAGGLGTDTVSYANDTLGVTVSFLTQSAQGVGTGLDNLSGFENITGGSGNDSLIGDSSNNVLNGNAGIDTVSYVADTVGVSASLNSGLATGAGIGSDTLLLLENIEGGSGNDSLIGSTGVNTLTGNAGSDTIEGLAGDDILDGGAGTDTVSFSNDSTGVSVSLLTNTAVGAATGNDTLSGFENIAGGTGADTLIGDSGDNILDGNTGNDTVSYADDSTGVTASLLDQTATGTGIGTDTLFNLENIVGGTGQDTLIGDSVDNVLDGGDGIDTVSYVDDTQGITATLLGSLSVGSNTGTDTLSNIENILGGSGNDTLTGDSGANTLTGNDGDDIIEGLEGDDVLSGDGGTDTVTFASDSSGVTVSFLTQSAEGVDTGTDTLSGFENITGGSGDDTLIGDSGDNILDGGDGIDTVSYVADSGGITASLVGSLSIGSNTGTDTLSNLENIIGGSGNDTLTGDSGANTLTGNDGDDIIEGLEGDDVLSGDGGTDTVTFANDGSGVTVSFLTQTAEGVATGTDTLSGFENITGGTGQDTLIGDSGNNILDGNDGVDTVSYVADSAGITASLVGSLSIGSNTGTDTLSNLENIIGGSGNDTLTGDSGANTLTGNDGDDIIEGLEGNDVLSGDGGTDTVSFANDGTGVTISFLTQTAVGAASGTDTLSGFENILGGTGQDTLIGDSGNNILDGNDGIDTVSYVADSAGITASLVGSLSIGSNTGTDTLANMENILGGSGADTLTGDSGANTLTGNDGDDIIEGLEGNDVLSGDGGTDTVSFANDGTGVTISFLTQTAVGAASGTDTLSGFENILGGTGQDTLIGDSGNNILDGNDGVDTVSYAADSAGVTASLLAGQSVGANTGTDTLSNLENIIGGSGNDTLTGDSGANTLTGNDGDDIIEGLEGGDVLSGDGGTDTVSFASDSSGVTVSFLTQTAEGASTGTDTLSGFENILGGSGNDTLIGDSGNNILDGNGGTDTVSYVADSAGITASLVGSLSIGSNTGTDTLSNLENIIGGSGNDTLTGDSGANTLTGNDGDDIIEGLEGNDVLSGDGGTDTVSFANDGTGVTISFLTQTAVGAASGTDTLSGFENILGGTGNDTLIGDSGNNVLDGNDGIDTVSYVADSAGITASLAGSLSIGSNTGTDTLSNLENIIGGSGADTLTGDSGDNTLTGNNGDDIIEGLEGDDVLSGDGGTDTVTFANDGSGVTVSFLTQTAVGAASGTDTLSGFENITGGSGQDTLIGDSGDNILDGGDGIDTVSYVADSAGITASLLAGQSVGANTGTDTLSNLENIIGGSGNDTLTGDSGANTLTGNNGDDIIEGLEGNDVLSGDGGTDTVSFASDSSGVTVSFLTQTAEGASTGTDTLSGFENITGGSGQDTLIGDSGDNILDGGAGIDTVSYTADSAGITASLLAGQSVGANTGTDTLSNLENIIGGSGNDTLTGDSGANTLTGNNGDDIIEGLEGNDVLSGDGGTDTVSFASDSSGVTVSFLTQTAEGSSTGTDTLSGFENITGGSGQDTLIGDSGDNILDGGAGVDTVSYVADSGGITASLVGSLSIGSNTGTDTLSNLENIIGGSGNDTLTGDSGDNTLTGNSGDDIIEGLEGDDVLSGGQGTDTVSFANDGTGVTVSFLTQTAVGAASGNDTLSGFENITGGTGADTLIGDSGDNILDGGDGIDTVSYVADSAGITASLVAGQSVGANTGTDTLANLENIIGGSGNDTLTGDSGDNTLTGNNGDDIIEGLEGNDVLSGDGGTDTVSFANDGTGVTISFLTQTAVGAASGTDTLSGFENILGGSGADTLIGDSGDNILDGGDGIDTVSYAADGAGITASLLAGQSIGTNTGTDTLSNIENLIGGSGNDTLTGDSGANTITGNNGDDIIEGLEGNDVLSGDGGTDTVSFASDSTGVTVNLLTGQAVGASSGTDTISGFENITGGSGADTLIGDSADNVLDGGDGIDTVSYADDSAGITASLLTGQSVGANTGTDTLSNLENIIGGSGNDTLTGDSAANTLTGNSGDDIIEGLGGNDVLSGDGGTDTVSFASDSSGVTVSFQTQTAVGSATGTDTLSGFENITGGSGADTLSGDSAANTITGNSGDDIIEGFEGNDVLSGDGGTDTVTFANDGTGVTVSFLTQTAIGAASGTDTLSGFENITGGSGADILIGDSGDNILDGGDGIDTVSYAADGAGITASLLAGQSIGTNTGTDTLSNIENLIGGSGNDTLTGDSGDNTITGNNGDDIIEGLEGDDVLSGGQGTDTVSFASDSAGVTVNLLTGQAVGASSGTDTISGFENITGGSGADTLIGDSADNILDGGAGIDTVSYADDSAGITASLLTGQSIGANTGTDTLSNLENIIGGSGNDTLTGDSAANTLTGNSGDDIIEGLGGNDVLSGDGGTDTVSFASDSSGVTVNLLTNTAIGSGTGTDTLSGFENITGGSGDDTLIGDSADNVLDGGAGTDVVSYADDSAGVSVNLLTGQAIGTNTGTDTLSNIEDVLGGSGNDTLIGDGGDNVLDGGDGTDTVSYADDSTGITASLLAGQSVGANTGTDTLSNIENLVGGSGNDTLTGDSGANIITGNNGDDIIEGLEGHDVLSGGQGTDTVSFASDSAGVTVNLLTGQAVGASSGTDAISGFENITGGSGADTLIGDSGDNVVTGNNGNDVIEGLGGDDTLSGGEGTDTVSFANDGTGVTVSLITGQAVGAATGTDTLSGFENITGGTGADTLIGDSGDNVLDGGDGIDTVSFAADSAGITASLTDGQAIGANTGTDTLSNLENIIGGSGADTLTGDSADNTLTGNGGDDIIEGLGGDDVLSGDGGTDTVSFASDSAGVTVDLINNIAEGSNTGTDTLSGFENITGGSGDDTLIGDGNDNVLDGGAGTDTVSYAADSAGITASLITGQAVGSNTGTDTLSNIENITGGSGDDTLIGDSGDNVLAGGDGTDTVSYADDSTGVTVSLITGQAVGAGTGTDTLSGFENVIGGSGDDTLIGDSADNVLDGGDGTDTVSFADDNAGVTASLTTGQAVGSGTGTDTLSNIENLTGGSGNDTLTGDGEDNVIAGGGGDDVIEGLGGNDTLAGDGGTDTVSYASDSSGVTVNLLTGEAIGAATGTDSLSGFENITAGTGDDTLIGDSADNILNGGDGTDTVSFAADSAGVVASLTSGQAIGSNTGTDTLSNIENLVGGSGNDTLTGDSGANSLTGGNGNDVLEGLGGDDVLAGGEGTDTVSFASDSTGVTVNLLTGQAVGAETGTDSLSGFENVTGGSGKDTITGDSGNNVLDGGAGSDTASFGTDSAGVNASLATGQAIGANIGTDTLSNFENLTGGSGNDTLTGDSADNIISGDIGNDIIEGGAGDDTLAGDFGTDTVSFASDSAGVTVDLINNTAEGTNSGTDTLSGFENITGGSGNDTLIGDSADNVLDGGDGTDTVSYDADTAGITVSLGDGVAMGSNTGTDTLSNIENVIGGSGNDTITGDSAANTLTGNGGDDIIDGAGGDDVLSGDGGTDTVSFASDSTGVSVNLLLGSAVGSASGTDTLSGFENVQGGSGDDTITGDSADNILDGGAGSDTASFGTDSAGVTANLTTGQATGANIGTDTLTNFENLAGGSGNDTLTGDNTANSISGDIGDDVIEGLGGDDTLAGDFGTDTVSYASDSSGVTVNLLTGQAVGAGTGTDTLSGFENITGGSGDDTLTGDSADNVLDGGDGTDTVSYDADSGGITVSLGDGVAMGSNTGTDTLSSIENVIGGSGNDTITGDSAANSLAGGAGNDSIEGQGGDDVLAGGEGTDTVSFASDSAGVTVNLLTGSATGTNSGTDTLSGFENITGGAGNDTLTGDSAKNVLDGGDGTDLVSYYDDNGGVSINLTTGQAVGSNTGTDTLSNIEDVFGGQGNDTITGDGADNSLWGKSGNDVIDGGGGDDELVGGSGTDTVSFASDSAGVTVSLLTNTATGTNSGTDTLSGFENITGGSGNDTLIGDSTNNALDGGDGVDTVSYADDTAGITADLANGQASGTGIGTDTLSNVENLISGSGNDSLTGDSAANSLTGGDGDDVIDGAGGDDVLAGGDGTDTVSFASDSTGVTVSLATNTATGTNSGTDALSGFENITGGSGADTLTGDSGDNVIVGGAGDDALTGGDGTDTVSYASDSAGVTVSLAANTATGTNTGTDTLSGFENIIGGSGDDTLVGGDGDNTIEGLGGDDLLMGGNGTDTVSYASDSSGVSVSLSSNTATGSAIGTDALAGFENITGGSGADTLTGDGFANVLDGGAGDDSLVFTTGQDSFVGGSGTDSLVIQGSLSVDLTGSWDSGSSSGLEEISLGSGSNTLTIGNSSDWTSAFDTNSVIYISGSADDTVSGADWLYQGDITREGTTFASFVLNGVTLAIQDGITLDGITTTVEGSAGGDTITGNSWADTINGNDGDDTVEGSAGNDIIAGGQGTDTISYATQTNAVTVNLATGTAISAATGTDALSGFENVIGGSGNDSLIGDSSDNVITANAGDDYVDAGAGNDFVIAGTGTGDDIYYGGSGTDTISFASTTQGVTIDLESGYEIAISDETGFDEVYGFEVVIGGTGDDQFWGGTATTDSFYGGDGDDLFFYTEGTDLFSGGAGTDTLALFYAGTLDVSGTNWADANSSGLEVLQLDDDITVDIGNGAGLANAFYNSGTGVTIRIDEYNSETSGTGITGDYGWTLSGTTAIERSVESYDEISEEVSYSTETLTYDVYTQGSITVQVEQGISVSEMVDNNVAPTLSDATGSFLSIPAEGDQLYGGTGESVIAGAGDFTVETWFKLGAVSAANSYGVFQVGSNAHGAGLEVWVDGNTGQLTGSLISAALETTIFGATTLHSDVLQAGQWYHVAVSVDRDGNLTTTLNDTAQSIAINGGSNASVDIFWNSYEVTIGDTESSKSLQGDIDEFRVWNDVRTAQEISDNKSDAVDPSDSSLVTYFSMDGTANTGATTASLIDESQTGLVVTTTAAPSGGFGIGTGAATVTQSVGEDSSLTFSGLAISDSNDGSGTYTATLSVDQGTLSLTDQTNVSVTGNGTDTIIVSGSMTAINAVLDDNLSYRPTSGFTGQDSLDITVADDGNGGPVKTATSSNAFLVTAVDDAPSLALGAGPALYDFTSESATQIDANLVLTDDNTDTTSRTAYENFSGTISIQSGGDDDDTLSIENVGLISVSGNSVIYAGSTIATIDTTNATGPSAQLTFTATSDATLDGLQALLRAVSFEETGTASVSGEREITIDLDDSTLVGLETAATRTVVVAPITNDPNALSEGDFLFATADGTVSAGAGQDLGGIWVDDGVSLEINGTLTSGGASYVTNDATLALEGAGSAWSFATPGTSAPDLEVDGLLAIDGGTLVNGDIQVDGNLYLADADATPTIGANADLTLNGIGYSDAGTVVIDGDLVNTGYMSFGNTAGDASLVTGTGSFDNSGLLDFFDLQTNNTVNVNFDNSGTVKVELEGTLNLSNGTNSGTLSLDDGAVLNFGSGFTLTDDSVIGYHGEGNSYGTITFDDVLTLSGTTTVDGNIDLILDGTVSAPLTGSGELDTAGDVVFNSGTITDPSIVTRGETALVTAEERDIETLWTNHGTFYMSDGTLEIDNTGTLQNHGTLELSGGVLDINAGDNALINAADGYMLITGTNSLSTSASTGGNIDNAGVILYERDELFSFSSALTNSGTIDIDQGTLLLATSGGDFGGDYEIDVFGNLKFTNTSTLSDAGVTGGGNILVHSTRLAVSNSTATTFAASLIFMDSSTLALSNEALTIDALNNEGAATLAYDASDSLVVTGESTLSDVIIDGVGSGQVVNQGLMTFSNLFGTSTFLTGDALMNDTDGWITIGDGLGNTQVTDEGMGNFVNKGLFVLDELHSDGVSGGDASFVKTEGTLENAGTISFSDQLGGATGARTIEALINNTGLIELWGVDATLNFNTAVAASHINAGTIDLGTTGQVFDLNGTGALDLVNSGVIAGAGTISLNDVGFDNSQGTLEVGGDGSHGVLEISSNGTLDFSGLIEMEICGTEAGASHDQLVLSGQSVINAAEFSIDMSDGSGYQDGAVYDIALINASSAAYGDVDFTDEDLYSGTLGSLDATIAEITVNGGTLSLTGVDVTDIASSASASTGADYYLGSNSAESFGTDMGTLGSGSDVFLGFGGDDTLAITSDGATLPFSYVDGGSGLDRLSLYAANEAGETVSFLDDIWRTNSFEVIDLADADGQTLKLDKDAIEAFDNDVDQLINMNGTLSLTGIESYVVVDGDANDTLDLSADGGTWTMSGTAELDSSGSGGTKEGYTMYANGDARVFVDQDVNVT